MTMNVGSVDKILRIVLGAALILFALLGPETIAWKWIGFIGIVPLATGIFGWCPAYTMLGLSTCPRKTRA